MSADHGVSLRRLNADDASTLARWLSSSKVPDTVPTLSLPCFREPETWQRIAASKAAEHYFIIELAETSHPIGLTVLYQVDTKTASCYGGTVIFDPDYQHKGYGYIAKLLQHQYAFHKLGLKSVRSKSLARNTSVVNGLTRMGYKKKESTTANLAGTPEEVVTFELAHQSN